MSTAIEDGGDNPTCWVDDAPTCWVKEGQTVSLDTVVRDVVKPSISENETAFMDKPTIDVFNSEIHTVKSASLFKDVRYEVRKKLGRGGQGTVYLVWDSVVEKPFAIKVLPQGHLNDKVNFARFQDEIKIPQRIKHPL
ncbi:MAG: hypothetical protein HQK94_14875, partial [Nitrospirae bacterium]|nr:hypothetical protein [Nitrospirota bacterium]